VFNLSYNCSYKRVNPTVSLILKTQYSKHRVHRAYSRAVNLAHCRDQPADAGVKRDPARKWSNIAEVAIDVFEALAGKDAAVFAAIDDRDCWPVCRLHPEVDVIDGVMDFDRHRAAVHDVAHEQIAVIAVQVFQDVASPEDADDYLFLRYDEVARSTLDRVGEWLIWLNTAIIPERELADFEAA
jgi:hypothetical protein